MMNRLRNSNPNKAYFESDLHRNLRSLYFIYLKVIFLSRAVNHLEEICDEKPQELVFENLKHQYKLWKYWMTLETNNFKSDINNREGEVILQSEIIS